ncbi:sugar ABC transporter ATP-binding protein [Mucilaginibacter sp. SMC90]|uniref:sugar ABC transporter ATP-binding protein n=1 Tax=Mucilaginibacter sp. SMC90 TaxID=2929803 RepID=UPI001FB351A3|nr:sugar ABC transporter ATP-binding protein [Mucilaginibacter sp. SMC90]UOE46549.1 sugar ABC transporter ATP-binding protein [Mucilaginibacter sp. SMC90]
MNIQPSGSFTQQEENAAAIPSHAGMMLHMQDICKDFSSVSVLKNVQISLQKGEVLALMGENGAGKSTLMKILCGIHQPTAGTIKLDGNTVAPGNVSDAMQLGFILIHQELNLLDNLDIAGNLFLGREFRTRLGLLDKKKLYAEAEKALQQVGLNIDPHISVAELSIAQQQLVEIAKALSQNAKILVMDEPTSSLTLKETEQLFQTILQLKEQGVSIIYISHRLNEIIRIADRAVVLRDGKNSGELSKNELNHENLIRLMVGRDIQFNERSLTKFYGEPKVFRLEALRTSRFPDREVTMQIQSGEIVGISGLIGSGRTELAETIFGIRHAVGGTLSMNGHDIKILHPRHALDKGIFLVPEDRKKQGIFTEMSITENISMPNLSKYARASIINRQLEESAATGQVKAMNVKCNSPHDLLKNLSGGNQQKVAIAKWLAMQPAMIIFDEPTRGVDIGAKDEIYKMMRQLSNEGIIVMVISSDMEEIIRISDRVIVMCEGQITGELYPADYTEENIMALAVGNA